jgi:antitoxin component YwqK of YwqJK toxin-antitoxin module
MSLVLLLFILAADDDLRALKVPPEAVQRNVPIQPWGSVKWQTRYFVGTDVVAEHSNYEGGHLADERLYKNRKLHGIWRQYHPNGSLFAERPYRNGQMDGTFRFWDDRATLLGESQMKNGTGLLRGFACDALLSPNEETPYVDGKIEGSQTLWGKFDECVGVGCRVSSFVNNRLDGWQVTRDEDGTLIGFAHFKEGQLHGVVRKFRRDGSAFDGYPKFHFNGRAVDEGRFSEAAKSDKLLAETLKYSPVRVEKIPLPEKPRAEARASADFATVDKVVGVWVLDGKTILKYDIEACGLKQIDGALEERLLPLATKLGSRYRLIIQSNGKWELHSHSNGRIDPLENEIFTALTGSAVPEFFYMQKGFPNDPKRPLGGTWTWSDENGFRHSPLKGGYYPVRNAGGIQVRKDALEMTDGISGDVLGFTFVQKYRNDPNARFRGGETKTRPDNPPSAPADR